MQPDDPRHGTYAGVQAHHDNKTKHCTPCLNARRRYQKGLEYDWANGRTRRVALDHVRNHITKLRNNGMPMREIARLAGVSLGTAYRAAGMYNGEAKSINRATAARILTVRPTTPESGYIDRTGSVRRLQALIAIGHRQTDLARMLGMSGSNISSLINGLYDPNRPRTRLQASTAQRIADLYDRLHLTPGDNWASRGRAKRHGWAPPLAWDNIDDPNEKPYRPRREDTYAHNDDVDEAVVERFLAGEKLRTTPAERREIMRRWLASGRSERSLCSRTGWKEGRYSPTRQDDAA